MRVLWLGIDALHWGLVNQLAGAGRMPHFAAWLAQAHRAPCRSTMPPMSPAAWNTAFSGLSPARHGIMDFLRQEPGTYMLSVRLPHYAHGAVWRYLEASGRNSVLYNAIFADARHISPRVKVLMPPAHRLEESDSFYRVMLDEVGFAETDKRAFLSRRLDNPILDHRRWKAEPDYRAETLGLVQDSMQARFRFLAAMLERPGWDLLLTVFTDFDALQHCALQTLDLAPPGPSAAAENPIRVAAEAFDQGFGELLRSLDGQTMLVVNSDHGMTRVSRSLALNRWLELHGYLTKSGEPRSNASASYEIEDFHRFVDWKRTRAYTFGLHGGLRLNLAGREPLGAIRPEERPGILRELRDRLLEWERQTGQRIFRSIHLRDGLYAGENAEAMPDLVLEFESGTMCDPSLFAAGDPLQPHTHNDYSAMHEVWGMFAAGGPGLAPGPADQVRIEDLTPTVLHLLGAPIPRGLDGRVIAGLAGSGAQEFLDFDFGLSAPGRPQPVPRERDETAQIMENLAALGYIEAAAEAREENPPQAAEQEARFVADLQTRLQDKDQAMAEIQHRQGAVLEDLYARIAAQEAELADARQRIGLCEAVRSRAETLAHDLAEHGRRLAEARDLLARQEASAQDLARRLESAEAERGRLARCLEDAEAERDRLRSESLLDHVRRSLRRRLRPSAPGGKD